VQVQKLFFGGRGGALEKIVNFIVSSMCLSPSQFLSQIFPPSPKQLSTVIISMQEKLSSQTAEWLFHNVTS
jgi:hypothetical protein